jgi:FkbM family methyltransferase
MSTATPTPLRKRALFIVGSLARFRSFDKVVAELNARDVQVIVASDDASRVRNPADLLSAQTHLEIVEHPFRELASHPGYRAMGRLRGAASHRFRAEHAADPVSAPLAGGADARAVERSRSRFRQYAELRGWMRDFEARTPATAVACRFIRQYRPDVVVVTPLAGGTSLESEYIKAAKTVGIPVVGAVLGWDDANDDREILVVPDAYCVWTESQEAALRTAGGLPPEVTRVMGNWRLDPVLALRPRGSRKALLAARELDPARATLAYVTAEAGDGFEELRALQQWLSAAAQVFDVAERPNLIVQRHPGQALDSEALQALWSAPLVVSATAGLRPGDRQDWCDEISAAEAVVCRGAADVLPALALAKPVLLAPAGGEASTRRLHAAGLLRPGEEVVLEAADLAGHAGQVRDLLAGGFPELRARLSGLAAERIGARPRAESSKRFVRFLKDQMERRRPCAEQPEVSRLGWLRVFFAASRMHAALEGERPASLRKSLADLLIGLCMEAADARSSVWRGESGLAGFMRRDPGQGLLRFWAGMRGLGALARPALALSRRWWSLRQSASETAALVADAAAAAEDAEAAAMSWRLWHADAQRRSLADAQAGTGEALSERSVESLDYPKADLRLYCSTQAERELRTQIVAKEPRTIEWLEAHVREGDTLFDIGANVGGISLIAGHLVGPEGWVFAFEPGAATFAALCENVGLNRMSDRIVPVPTPLADKGRIVRFTYRTAEAGQSRHRMTMEGRRARSRRPESTGKARIEQLMLSLGLDALREAADLPVPDVVKLDVDGAEGAIVRGAAATFAEPGCRAVIAEIELQQLDGIREVLADAGFAVRDEWRHEGAGHGYFLFLKDAA